MPRQVLQEKELRVLFLLIVLLFVVFLAAPLALVLVRSLTTGAGALTLANYLEVFSRPDFVQSIANSFAVSAASAFVAVLLAFLLSYTVNCTNVPAPLKRAIGLFAQLPMLVPTITYGFAIIYTFGRQGLLTRLLGFQLFDIYGFGGLMLGYVIYTLPTAFLLVDNSFRFIDKRFMFVSRLMGDRPLATLLTTVVRPLAGALSVAFVQSFFLAFTDYGIPTSVGGQYNVVALELFNQMLGALPDFNEGAVIAVVMLIPSIASIILMAALERFAIRYNKITPVELSASRVRDGVAGGLSVAVLVSLLSVFAVILIVPFVEMWPYRVTFTLDHVASVITDPDLAGVLANSLVVAVPTALVGCALAYAAALVTARSNLSVASKRIVDSVSGVISTVPGMVLGIAFLFAFSGTPIQGTFAILIICNVVHYFATPYQMMKDSLTKMSASWETTAKLMGDSWIKTIVRVVTPNAWPTILQVFEMMAIVEPEAARAGYKPDFSITPDSTGGHGRPFPYMVFRNLEALGVSCVRKAAKVGDTVSDIKEGTAAGVISIGVVEGSSEMGLTQDEYEGLAPAERDAVCERVAATFRAAGADAVIRNLSELPTLLAEIA